MIGRLSWFFRSFRRYRPPDVLPAPDRSVYRGIEVAGRMAVLRAKRQRES